MASPVEHQFTNGSSHGMNGNGPHKGLADAPTINRPPSPPTTETDTETESDIPKNTNIPVLSALLSVQQDRDPDSIASATGNLVTAFNPPENIISMPDSPVISPVTSPPYWMNYNTTNTNTDNHNGSSSYHSRSISNTSVESIPTGGITLRDNENSSLDERGSACWAKSVQVVDYMVVNGGATSVGAFVVYNIRVETLNGSYMNIRKRYSEFDDFRWRLIRTFPGFEAAVPELPPKSIISKFRPRFLEKRRAGLQYFLNCILLNPEFSGSPVLKEFLFS